MDGSQTVALAVGVVVGAVLVGVVALGAVGFASFSEGDPDDAAAELTDFETTDPHCGDRWNSSGSSATTPRAGPGETLVVNSTIPVAGPESSVDAGVSDWGPERYELELTRDPGAVAGDCDYEVRFLATVSFPVDDWTLLVTYDDVLVAGHWREGSGGGSFEKAPHPEPAPVSAGTATAS